MAFDSRASGRGRKRAEAVVRTGLPSKRVGGMVFSSSDDSSSESAAQLGLFPDDANGNAWCASGGWVGGWVGGWASGRRAGGGRSEHCAFFTYDGRVGGGGGSCGGGEC